MIDISKILPTLPEKLRNQLIENYQEIVANYLEHRWEPAELNGGKFCETVYSIAIGHISGSFPDKPEKPQNMVDACRSLENESADSNRIGDRSFRILIPRVIQPLYEIRNNRGVGHVGGDVNPNFLDATAVYSMSSWILAEVIRVFHAVSTKEAQEIVNSLVERKSPLIWEVESIKRVLDPKMNKSDQTLLLLHVSLSWISGKDLANWTEYSNLTTFRNKVLIPLHRLRLIEYDEKQDQAQISPLGIKKVEQEILIKIAKR